MQADVTEAGARNARVEDRHLEFAALLGEHSAKIRALEADKVDFNNQLREIRSMLQRIEHAARAPTATPSQDLMLAVQAVNRAADILSKAPPAPIVPPQPPVHELVQALVAAMRPASNTVGPVSLMGYLTGIGAVVWVVRGLLGV